MGVTGVEGADTGRGKFDSPSSAARVSSNAFGNHHKSSGERGVARRVAQTDPNVVRKVNRKVASTGGNRAPPITFWKNLAREEQRK